jgi:Ser/Thr protein kinase RdoA (MazF antagonist)
VYVPVEDEYIYSRLSAKAIAARFFGHYGLGGEARCRFFVLGLHDNYLVEDQDRRFILRVYRNDWRAEEEIRFELELLTYLARVGVSVAGPIPARSGALYLPVEHAEGRRFAVLFPYAPGSAPGPALSPDQSHALGELVARVHHAGEGFTTSARRQALDLEYLLDASVDRIAPFLGADGLDYLRSVQHRLRAKLTGLVCSSPEFGVCVGDVNPSNFHVDAQGQLTLFDFDQCGHGWRAFDIGKFFSTIRGCTARAAVEQAFLAGYQSLSPLGASEIDAIPWFTAVAMIWVMAIQVYNAERIGYKWLDETAWARRLERLRAVDAEMSW